MTARSDRSRGPDAPLVLITGAASGIGLAATRSFLDAGWAVCGLDRNPAPAGLGAPEWIVCDLDDTDALELCIAGMAQRTWSAVICCAGVAGVGDVGRILRINFLAARRIVDGLAPHVADGGAIILISSGAGMQWTTRQAALRPIADEADPAEALRLATMLSPTPAKAYEVSKQLLCFYGAYRCLDHHGRGVRINIVSPGGVDTPLTPDFARSMGAQAMDFSLSVTNRYAAPEEIADVVLFLASPQAGWINGAEIRVDGGLTGALTAGAVQFADWA